MPLPSPYSKIFIYIMQRGEIKLHRIKKKILVIETKKKKFFFPYKNTNFLGHRLKDAIRLGHEECLLVGALSFLRLQLKLLPVAKLYVEFTCFYR
ncbi:hypothetical protein RclHR1_00230001 [Rhizophagus clarus]|uniref:Uncharacterized protein n=1 Tax=Rhizophagus clarus TaxID=94130 RepID=A0A2Z6QUW4_9GLOM|nr:hypothetical protein RclHR1_00230001 [Rhizophagus clarus]